MPYDVEATEPQVEVYRTDDPSLEQPDVYALFESLNGELLRQKIMFESELRRQREAMGARITRLEGELEQREADCKSLQNSVTILGRSLDTITEALEKVAPNLGSAPSGNTSNVNTSVKRGRPSTPRAASPATSRAPSPQSRAATPTRSGSKGRSSSAPRPSSPDGRRSRTPIKSREHDKSGTGIRNLKIGTNKKVNGAVPVITSKRGSAPSHKGPTAVKEITADYIAGIRHPGFLQSSIFPPEGMEDLQGMPSQLPDAKLELSHIYGCSVGGYNDNVLYSDSGVVLYSAAVGVAIDAESGKQSFCFHHSSEITAIAVHPSLKIVATAQIGGRVGPSIAVWDVDTKQCRATLKDFHEVEVSCMAFSPDGAQLATIGGVSHHTLGIYKWESKDMAAHCRISNDAVYNAAYNPFNHKMMVIVGKRMVKFVEVNKVSTKLSLKLRNGALVKEFSLADQRVVCVAFTDAETTVTGTDNGAILIWKSEALTYHLPNAHAGGVSSIKALYSRADNEGSASSLYSCGRDGIIRCWTDPQTLVDLSLDDSVSFTIAALVESSEAPTVSEECLLETLRIVTTGKSPVRSMDVKQTPSGARLVCVLFSNQVIEVDLCSETPKLSILLQGHSALPTSSLQTNEHSEDVSFFNVVNGVSPHPRHPIVATTGSDSTVRFWNVATNELCYVLQIPGKGLCLDFSPDGNMLAVGMELGSGPMVAKGGGLVFSVTSTPEGMVTTCRMVCALDDSTGESTFCVRFDPLNKRLAVGGGHNRVDLYDIAQGYKRIGATKGHNTEVLHIDWSADGTVLQTDDSTPEHLYFTKEGSRVTRPIKIRSQTWGKWSCMYGWHVQGIWDEHMSAASVNSVDRCAEGDLCVVGDNTANVSLYAFPLPMQQASHKKYRGHSQPVMSVAFHPTNSTVFSSSADGTLFQWTVIRSV